MSSNFTLRKTSNKGWLLECGFAKTSSKSRYAFEVSKLFLYLYKNFESRVLFNKKMNSSGATFLTDSRDDRWVVTALNFFDESSDFIYFTAARSVVVGNDEKTEQRKRQIFRVKSNARNLKNPECVTCDLVK